MPYVEKDERAALNKGAPAYTSGQLNYLLTKLCVEYIGRIGASYATFNEVVGALECCKQELYRRMVAPYEDLKRGENGDVYPDVRPRTGFIRGMAHGTGGNEIVPDIEGRDL